MLRWRFDDNGQRTLFEPERYGNEDNPYYKVEIRVATLDEVSELYKKNQNLSLRMGGQPEGRAYQRSTINADQIEGLGLVEGHYEGIIARLDEEIIARQANAEAG